jgi:hypothetical protein
MAVSLKRSIALLSLAGALAVTPRAQAQTWINWTALSGSGGVGTINLPGGPVTVTVTGSTIGGQLSSGGTNYWTPEATWAGGGSAPTNPGFVQLNTRTQLEVTFSTPVDLYMALLSVGQNGDPITYTFDTPFSIVSQGPASTWGGCDHCLLQDGSSVTGTEGDGTLHFTGPVSTLSISTTPDEYWHGFTFGANDVTTTPEPASIVLLASGLAGVFGAARRKRKA